MELDKAEQLAREYLNKHGLESVKIEFTNGYKVAGTAYFERGVPVKLQLSKRYVTINSEEIVLGIILHEIAHLLVGTHHRHEHKWKQKVREIGGIPEKYISNVEGAVLPKQRYVLSCDTCGYTTYRGSLKPFVMYYCPKCCKGRKLNEKFALFIIDTKDDTNYGRYIIPKGMEDILKGKKSL